MAAYVWAHKSCHFSKKTILILVLCILILASEWHWLNLFPSNCAGDCACDWSLRNHNRVLVKLTFKDIATSAAHQNNLTLLKWHVEWDLVRQHRMEQEIFRVRNTLERLTRDFWQEHSCPQFVILHMNKEGKVEQKIQHLNKELENFSSQEPTFCPLF